MGSQPDRGGGVTYMQVNGRRVQWTYLWAL